MYNHGHLPYLLYIILSQSRAVSSRLFVRILLSFFFVLPVYIYCKSSSPGVTLRIGRVRRKLQHTACSISVVEHCNIARLLHIGDKVG